MTEPREAPRTSWSRLLIAAAIVLLVFPVVADLWISDARRPFGYLAADAFYYLTVARNIVEHGRVSFDQQLSTNGFHPLWQIALALLYLLASALGVSEPGILAVTVLANIACLAGALYLLGRALTTRQGELSPLFLALPIGLYGLLMTPYWMRAQVEVPLYGTLRSYANGMESSLTLLFFAAAAWVYVRGQVLERRRDAITFGAVLALLSLSRLDHAIFAVALVVAVMGTAANSGDRKQWLRAMVVAATFAIPIVLYCLGNLVLYGSPIPVSGSIKSSFPNLVHANFERIHREAQTLIPALFAVLALGFSLRLRSGCPWIRFRARSSQLEHFVAVSALGVLGLAAYNVCYVDLPSQGHWYFPVSTLYPSLVLAVVLAGRGWTAWLVRGRLAFAVAAACAVAVPLHFVRFQRWPSYNQVFSSFYFDEAPRIRRHYGAAHIPRLVEIDDSIVSFATGFPAMAGMGLVLDREAAKYFRHGRLVELAVRRGYDRLTSVAYMNTWSLKSDSPSDEVWRYVSGLATPTDRDNFRFSVEYLNGNFTIIRVEPKSAAASSWR